MKSKYQSLLELAFHPDNKLTLRPNGWGLIVGPRFIQGIWISRTIIQQWREEKWL